MINYEKEGDYIAVTVKGDFSLSNLKDLAAEVTNFTKQYSCNRILNDMRQAQLIFTTCPKLPDFQVLIRIANGRWSSVSHRHIFIFSKQCFVIRGTT